MKVMGKNKRPIMKPWITRNGLKKQIEIIENGRGQKKI